MYGAGTLPPPPSVQSGKFIATSCVDPSENVSVAVEVWLPSVPAPMNAMRVASAGSDTGTVCPSPLALSGEPAATAGSTKCNDLPFCALFGTVSSVPCGAPAAASACRE